jgi:hypothetical protein
MQKRELLPPIRDGELDGSIASIDNISDANDGTTQAVYDLNDLIHGTTCRDDILTHKNRLTAADFEPSS